MGGGIALANRDDTPTQVSASNSQLAMLNQACTDWLDDDPSTTTLATWCDDMTGWMNQQMTNGSVHHQMMWTNPDQMLATCRAWTNTNSAVDHPSDWCDNAIAGMWQHMGNGWDHRNDWDRWMSDHPMMGG